jgi:hypothetical protein
MVRLKRKNKKNLEALVNKFLNAGAEELTPYVMDNWVNNIDYKMLNKTDDLY